MPDLGSSAPGADGPQGAHPETGPPVDVVDAPAARVHSSGDLLGAVLAVGLVAAVMLLAVFAHDTTVGVAQDVQGFAALVRRILVVPVALFENVVTILVPVAVLAELTVRRLGRQVLEAAVAALLAFLLCLGLVAALRAVGSPELVRGLSVLRTQGWVLSVPSTLAALSGLLTAAGPRGRRRTVAWSWNLVWVSLGVVLVTGQVSLPGSAVALLVGRVAGLGVRYVSGVQSERAYGDTLVDGIRRVGLAPIALVRVDDPADRAAPRRYDLRTAEGRRYSVTVLDGDRQAIGGLSRFWRSLRLRGIEGRSFVSLRQAAERAALMTYAAQAAGVRAPGLVGVAEAEDSMLLVQEHTGGAVPLDEVGDDVELGDDVLREIWAQVRLAHEVGLAHRALTSQTVLVELPGADDTTGPVVWLTGWDQGDIASSDLARRMDLTQMVALLAVRVGPERALASAAAVLPADDIAAIGPLLQPVVLPGRTRQEMREHREVLAGLRAALVERLPEADVEPERVARFGTRTLLTVVVPLVAVVVLLARINLDQIAAALEQSDWRWALAAFGFGLLTFVGAALAFTAFSPLKIPLRTAILVQTASAFVALAAPSGLGPAALNLRMLTRRGVSTALAVATVALVQVSQFVVTVALLVVLSVASGTNDAEQFAPRAGVLVAVGAVAALVAGALLVPVVRQWVLGKTLPVLRQTWPRLIEVVGEPRRVLLAVGGDLLMAVSWILAFDASLAAFGQHLSLVQAALVYFLGNAAGSAIPVPGGIGTIEFALIAGLSAAGINAGVAASAVFLFRAVTYWLQIPIGWAALHRLQRTGRL